MNVTILPDFPVFDSGSSNTYPGLLGTYYGLLAAYAAAQTWDEVLALHTPASRDYIEQSGMRITWEARSPDPWQITYSAFITLGDESRNAVLLAQSLPGDVPPEDFETTDSFSVFGARAECGQWRFDYTVQTTDLGRLLGQVPPAQVADRARSWYLQRLALVTWVEVVRHAEEILGYDTDVAIIGA